MFSKKKKKPQISPPTNFEHRVHTGYDKREGRYVGLPLQWASIVGNNQILKSTNRPLPLVDPSEITPTEILDLKTIVKHENKQEKPNQLRQNSQNLPSNGINLPKTSNVARSNSLRSSSPPRLRREHRNNANVPPSVPEEQIAQYPSVRRESAVAKPQARENSPALSNGNSQISPTGSLAVPGAIPSGMSGVGAIASAGVHIQACQQGLQHVGYPQRHDQNQNVKNGAQGAVPTGLGSVASTSAAKAHHEQRLTHEQVRII